MDPLGKVHASRLAVSIVLYRPEHQVLIRTLRSLERACSHATKAGGVSEVHLVLTDHSPQAATMGQIERWQQVCSAIKTHYHHNPRNPGFGAGHNAAFRRFERADFFLVANPDLEFADDSLMGGLSFLAARPSVGVIAPTLDEGVGVRPACFSYPSLAGIVLRGLGVSATKSRAVAHYECRHWNVSEPVLEPPLMSGCCLLFRASAYAELGGFDPAYFLYFEDFDLSVRARKARLSAYCPDMRVKHTGGGAVRKGLRHQILYLRSAWRFFSTCGWRGC